MLLVGNQFLIDIVGIDFFGAMPHAERRQIRRFEFLAVLVQNATGVVTEDFHLTQVGFGRQVALEAVGIAALLLAHLTVKLELLQAFGLDAIPKVFRGALFCFRHDDDNDQDAVKGTTG